MKVKQSNGTHYVLIHETLILRFYGFESEYPIFNLREQYKRYIKRLYEK